MNVQGPCPLSVQSIPIVHLRPIRSNIAIIGPPDLDLRTARDHVSNVLQLLSMKFGHGKSIGFANNHLLHRNKDTMPGIHSKSKGAEFKADAPDQLGVDPVRLGQK